MSDGRGISRRDLLRGRLGGARRETESSAAPAPPTGRIHRPPHAMAEEAFLAGCTKCGDCAAACPVSAIIEAPPRYGAAAGTPMIDPRAAACVMCADMPCVAACEPGVLSLDAPATMGTASIRPTYCIAHQGTLCTVCVERCPVEGALRLVNGRPVIDDGACTGCGVCQHVCPAPYNAVLILPRAAGDGAGEEAQDARFDWRAAYFKGRRLKAPEGLE